MSEAKSSANAMVLATNGLKYQMPKPLSTTLVRTWKRQYSQRQTYSSEQTIVFDLNVTGQVDPEVSYLTFEMNADNDFDFGKNGVLSIIRDIRIQSKNGVELDRIQSYNAWSHVYLTNVIDKYKLDKKGRLTGISNNFTNGRYVIPLSWLSGLFRPHVKGQKVPSHLLSGARIEIVLESVNRALHASDDSNVPTMYTVDKPTLVLMEHTVNDNTLKVLTEESANNGLEYVYDRIFTSVESTSSDMFNTQIKKAVSQATSIVTTEHPANFQNDIKEDSFGTILHSTAQDFSYQYRLGSSYFPHQACTNLPEAFVMSSATFDSYREKGDVPECDWIDYLVDCFNISTPLKSEHSISSSGLAVNNSATIALEYKTSSLSGDGQQLERVLYTFLTYTALARVFLNQVSVKI